MSESPTRAAGTWAVVVVNFGAADLLRTNLQRTVESCSPDLVVVVDNFSSAEERRRVRELADDHNWIVVEPSGNTGFGGGVNLGVARARELGATEWLLLNPDARIDGASVALLRDAAARQQDLLVAPRIVDGSGRTWFEGADVYLLDGTTRGVARRPAHQGQARWDWVTGACMYMRDETWDLAGGFDESYFLYWEDVDFSRRIVGGGGQLAVVTDAVAIHEEGGTQTDRSSTRAKSDTYYYYNIRNRMLFAAKHLDPETRVRWKRTSFASAREILLRGGRRQFKHPVAPLRAAIRGLRDGRKLLNNSS